MITYKLIIPGKPFSKKAPKFARVGNGVRTYPTQAQATQEGLFLWETRQQYKGPKHVGAILLHVFYIFERPKSHYGTGRNAEKLKPSAPHYHIVKPDEDNCTKFMKDCLAYLGVYKNDSQVISTVPLKRWAKPGEESQTIITIKPLEGK